MTYHRPLFTGNVLKVRLTLRKEQGKKISKKITVRVKRIKIGVEYISLKFVLFLSFIWPGYLLSKGKKEKKRCIVNFGNKKVFRVPGTPNGDPCTYLVYFRYPGVSVVPFTRHIRHVPHPTQNLDKPDRNTHEWGRTRKSVMAEKKDERWQ